MIRVLLVSLGFGLFFSLVGFFIPIYFARDQGLALLAILTGPFGFVAGLAIGFVWEARRQGLLNAQRVVSLLYVIWLLMSLYYLYFLDRLSSPVLFGTTMMQVVVLIAICAITMLERSFRELPATTRSRQKIYAIATIVMTAMLLFPPYRKNLGKSPMEFEGGYVFVLNENFDASTHSANYFIDTERIILQWILACIVSCLYYYFLVETRRK